MDEREYDSTIDGYVETDPREYVKAERRRIDASERADIPDAKFEKIAGPLRHKLAVNAERPIKRRDFDRLEALTAEYKNELRAAIAFERRAGSLKPWSASDALKPWLHRLEVHGWRGPERAGILAMLEPGEELTAVDFRAVTTNRRKITRDDVRDWALGQRPKWEVQLPGSLRPSEYLARAGIPTDEQISKLERVAEQIEREAARPQWNNSPESNAGPHVAPR